MKQEKRWKKLDIRKSVRDNYGLWMLGVTEFCFILFLLIFADKLYVAINDNLDSNVALYKIFHDYDLWRDRTSPIPILGGVDRNILSCGYTFSAILYYIFETQWAYWLNYIFAIAFSGLGFYFLGKSLGKIFDFKNEQLFCIIGIIYIFIGMWPSAIIAFALIPWWVLLVSEIYRTRKLWLCIFFLILEYNISSVLIGVFLMFYTFLFCMYIFSVEKESRKCIVGMFASIVICFLITNGDLILKAFTSQSERIKILASADGYVYTESVSSCIRKFMNLLFLKDGVSNNSGVWSLRYIALPVVFIFFLFFHMKYKQLKLRRKFIIIYDVLISSIAFNAFVAAFDNCYRLRQIISFFSGFSFARFMWLSPFFILMAFIMVMQFLLERKFLITSAILICAVPISVMIDFDATSSSSVYNILHINYSANVLKQQQCQQVRWNDYYETNLFEQIKDEIDYNGEWSVAYGLEPCILQYSNIKTLDGYYSNYSLAYKNKWEKLIAPTLALNTEALNYWNESNGQRAYLYGVNWTMPDYNRDYDNDECKCLMINSEVLRELDGKYVFSRVELANADNLGFEYLGTWMDEDEVYKISVYKIKY